MMSIKNVSKHLAIIVAIVAALFFLGGCGSSETEPEEKVYIEGSEIDAALSDGESFKGKYINIVGKVFNTEKDGDDIAIQAYYDVDDYDQAFMVYASSDLAGSIKNDDYIKVDGKISGVFSGENMMGGEIKNLLIEAESIETGGYDDIYAPAESTKTVEETKEQHGISVTVDRIEYAKGEARVYVSLKNDLGSTASLYVFNAKAIQDGKQFEHKDNFEAGYDSDIGEVVDGASKEGVIRFKGLDPEKGFKLQMESYSDNWEIELEDFVFDIK